MCIFKWLSKNAIRIQRDTVEKNLFFRRELNMKKYWWHISSLIMVSFHFHLHPAEFTNSNHTNVFKFQVFSFLYANWHDREYLKKRKYESFSVWIRWRWMFRSDGFIHHQYWYPDVFEIIKFSILQKKKSFILLHLPCHMTDIITW